MRAATGPSASHQLDPVLKRLRLWADQQGRNQSEVARVLGVSRAAVSSWFQGLEARGQTATGRTFRYTRQRRDVQAKIAQVLGEPVESLRILSLGADGTTPLQAFAEPGHSPVIAPELWAAVQDVLGAVAVRGMSNALGVPERFGASLRHRMADVAESIEDVTATLIVEERRGHGARRTLFHHLVTVFVGRPEPDADVAAYLRSRREQVAEALERAALPSAWEPPWREPAVAVNRRNGPTLQLGTLVAPYVSAPWPPRTGTLVPVRDGSAEGHADTLAVIVGGPTSAAELAGGLLADALGSGFINDLDLIRRATDVRARRDGAGIGYFALSADWSIAPDRSFLIEHGLHLLRSGGVPGAWLMAMQAAALAGYPSLRRTLARMPELLVVVFATPAWRRLAAWRLAAHQRGTTGRAEGEYEVLESVTTGVPATDDERRILAAHEADAEAWLAKLDAADAILEQLVEERGTDPSRRTISASIDAPGGVTWLCVEDGVWQAGSGPVGDRQQVVFPGYVDDFADSQIDLAVEVFERMAEHAGHVTSDNLAALLERLPNASVTRQLTHRLSRWTGGLP